MNIGGYNEKIFNTISCHFFIYAFDVLFRIGNR